MVSADVLVTTENGQIVAGEIRLDGDRLTGHAQPGYETLLRNILGKAPADNVAWWFNHLPEYYNGSYLRVRLEGRAPVAKAANTGSDVPLIPYQHEPGALDISDELKKRKPREKSEKAWSEGEDDLQKP